MMGYIQTAMDNGFKAMEPKVVPLEAKHAGRGENAAGHIYTIYASIFNNYPAKSRGISPDT